ncbi:MULTISPECIES: hypothetical protein [Chitinophagaceae]
MIQEKNIPKLPKTIGFLVLFLVLLLNRSSAQFSTVTVSGKVLNENGQGIELATVSEEGSDNFASTDVNGFFRLRIQVERKEPVAYTETGTVLQKE